MQCLVSRLYSFSVRMNIFTINNLPIGITRNEKDLGGETESTGGYCGGGKIAKLHKAAAGSNSRVGSGSSRAARMQRRSDQTSRESK